MLIRHLLSEGEYVDLTKLNSFLPKKDRDRQLVMSWGPKLTQLQARCNKMLPRLVAAAGTSWANKLKGTVVTVRSLGAYVNAEPESRVINIDVTVFWDAPDATLAFAIGHELGHIALGHGEITDLAKGRQEEFDADDFGVTIAQALGYDRAEVFRFMHSKKGEYEQNNKWAGEPDSTHPTYTDREQRQQNKGFQLSKGGIEQIDALLTHLA
jgi:predicted Zn-dependent protease